MEITGKITHAFPEVTGTSKAGNSWKKREYVLETQETYPRKVFFDFFGERADQYPLAVGQMVKLSFDIESREYNGKWFTSIRGWKAESADAGSAPAPIAAPNPMAAAPAPVPGAFPPPPAMTPEPADDLPF